MSIRALIILDSISPQGIRLTTFQLRYHRYAHPEFLTHRKFSRNASSSRATPVTRMIEEVMRDPAMPVHWGKNIPGMQACEELSAADIVECKRSWLLARDMCVEQVQRMMGLGLHKQVANRILEPWMHINVLVTATDLANWFALRRHEDALPEIDTLASAMREALDHSTPNLLQPGEWHLPYVHPHERELPLTVQREVSVARCARVSYMTHDGKPTTLVQDQALFARLVGATPLHASPAEHQATPDIPKSVGISDWTNGWWNEFEHGNFTGWRQFRKQLPNEYVPDTHYAASQPQTYVA